MPKGKANKLVSSVSATMSFPCGYTYIGIKKSYSTMSRLHKKKCTKCIDNNLTITYNEHDILPSNLGKKDIDILLHNKHNKFITSHDLNKFDVLKN